MLRLKIKSIALVLLSSVVSSFVIPPEPSPTLVGYATTTSQPTSTATPILRHPYVISYDIEDAAEIRFRATSNELNDEEEIVVTIPASTEEGCSIDFRTNITVNGDPLHAKYWSVEDGLTTVRWKPSDLQSRWETSDIVPTLRSDWALQCACLTYPQHRLKSINEDCPQVGYILNYRLKSLGDSPTSGFALSFVQSPEPRLLHLTYSDPSLLGEEGPFDHTASLAASSHWSSPSLESFKSRSGSISSTTLFPTYATADVAFSTIASFSTVTTPVIQATPISKIENPVETPAIHAPGFFSTNTGQQVLHSDINKEHDRCTIEKFKQLATQVGTSVNSALQFVQDQISRHRECKLSAHHPFGTHQNETRATLVIEDSLNSHGPSELRSERDDQVLRALHLTSLIVVIVGFSCCIFACTRRDPRRRADRAARREERRNRRLYQQAACKHKWQSFMTRMLGKAMWRNRTETIQRVEIQDSDATWEKFARESSLEVGQGADEVSEEIQALRKAHSFVAGMIQGEGSGQRATKRQSMIRHTRSYSDSLNSEKSLLPPYTEKDEVVIIDGQLRSARRLAQLTPASSIIATSPLNSDCGSSDSEKE